MHSKSWIHLILLFTIICGCATHRPATIQQDNKAKTFAIYSGKANIYVYRNEMFAFASKLPIAFDGKPIGDLGAKTYFFFVVSPGEHEVICNSENESKLKLTVESDRNYFVWVEAKTGILTLRSNLLNVDEAAGRRGVEECRLLLENQ
jgi:hypothetical protein